MNIDFALDPTVRSNIFYTIGFLLGGFALRVVLRRAVRLAVSKVDDGDDEKDSMMELRARTIGALVSNVTGVVLWGVVVTMILSQWGVNIAPILAGAGVVGLAVGFGAQTLVKDVVNGFFILFENQFNVGDEVEVAGVTGKVVSLKLRTTELKGVNGETHVIPNSKIDKVTKK